MNSYQKAAVLAVKIFAAYFIAMSLVEFSVELVDRALSDRTMSAASAALTFMVRARPLIADAIHAVFGLCL